MSDNVQDLSAQLARDRLGDLVIKAQAGKKPADIFWQPILMDVAHMLDALNRRDALVADVVNGLDMQDLGFIAERLRSGQSLADFRASTADTLDRLAALVDRVELVGAMKADAVKRAALMAVSLNDDQLVALGGIVGLHLSHAHLRILAREVSES